MHVCLDLDAAKSEIPAILRGEVVTPVSGLGSNMDKKATDRRRPVAIIVGGAFSAEEFEEVRMEDVTSVPWVKVEATNVPLSERPPNPAYPATVIVKVKECLHQHGLLGGGTSVAHEGEVWKC